MSIEQIKNFVAVSADLATGGQPSEQQIRELAEHGFEAIVNLGLVDQSYSLPDEAGLVRTLGMAYYHIPVDFDTPTAGDLARFLAVMDACRGRKVFVHCAANMRVSCFVALYGEKRLGWSCERADGLIRRVWEPDDVWARFVAAAREGLSDRC